MSKIRRIPLGLLQIGSVLKKEGHDVEIIDASVERNCDGRIVEACRGALVVGVSTMTSEVAGALAVSDMIKRETSTPIVWGGIHPSLFPEMTCQDSVVDYVVYGEGERTLLELVQALEYGGMLEDIGGLAYKAGEKVMKNQPRDYIEMGSLPAVDYTLVDMSNYFEGGSWRKAVDIQTSRGCAYQCAFCVNHALGNSRMRFMSPTRVVNECERLVELCGANFITFVDDNFFADIKRAREICGEIIRRRLKFNWFAEVRADYFRAGFVDREFLDLAIESGLTNLTIGAESGVPYHLKAMKKGITVSDIIGSVRLLAETGIATSYSFIIGLPHETERDIMQTLAFIEQLRAMYPDAAFNVGVLRAYPKSEFTEYFVGKGLIEQPKSLRDFALPKYNGVYIDALLKPVWHKNPEFAYNVTRYAQIAYNNYNRESVRRHLRLSSLMLLPERIVQELARWRLRRRFFWFKLDIVINKLLWHLYQSAWARKMVRWKASAG